MKITLTKHDHDRGEAEMASAASATGSKKTMLRVLIFPFFATSHIEPFTDLAVRLVAAGPAVEATVAVTPANVPVVQSLLRRRGQPEHVKIATYPFPAVDGLPEGVENLGRATEADSWRIDAAALSENLTRPAQEALARGLSPDAVVTDVHFAWNVRVAGELGVPCVAFSAISAFPTLALHHLEREDVGNGDVDVVTVPQFPGPNIRVPRAELPRAELHAQQDCSGGGLLLPGHEHLVRAGAAVLRDVVHAPWLREARLLRGPSLLVVITIPFPGRRRRGRPTVTVHRLAGLEAGPFRGVPVLRQPHPRLRRSAAAARSRAGGRREALPVGGEGRGELDPAGGVVRACGRPRAPRHGVGPADGHTGAPGRRRVRDALRVELRPGDGDGGGAGADVAHGVRAVHHREVGDGGAGDRGAAVAVRRRPAKHQERGARGGPGRRRGTCGDGVHAPRRGKGRGEEQGDGPRRQVSCRRGGRGLLAP
uniref:Uncharacterized protein n=2 Tax=Aegilops tauschii subsp. strangulata TaxID=200361 RepID=A0A453JB32_AEGTS